VKTIGLPDPESVQEELGYSNHNNWQTTRTRSLGIAGHFYWFQVYVSETQNIVFCEENWQVYASSAKCCSKINDAENEEAEGYI
jgi:hypothetical protein